MEQQNKQNKRFRGPSVQNELVTLTFSEMDNVWKDLAKQISKLGSYFYREPSARKFELDCFFYIMYKPSEADQKLYERYKRTVEEYLQRGYTFTEAIKKAIADTDIPYYRYLKSVNWMRGSLVLPMNFTSMEQIETDLSNRIADYICYKDWFFTLNGGGGMFRTLSALQMARMQWMLKQWSWKPISSYPLDSRQAENAQLSDQYDYSVVTIELYPKYILDAWYLLNVIHNTYETINDRSVNFETICEFVHATDRVDRTRTADGFVIYEPGINYL